MSRSPRLLLAVPVIALSLAVPRASAQCSAGPFVGTPFAMSFADGGGVYARHEVFHKALGFAPGAPATWSGPPGSPNFNFTAALTNCSGWLLPLADVDAMSLGEDWILADAAGRAVVPPNRWGALVFSVTRGSIGTGNGAIRRESASGRDRVGADLFSYVLVGSAMPLELVGVTERVHDSREIDVGAAAQELDALDSFMPLFASEPFVQASMSVPARMFFTVSAATLGQVHPFAWAGTAPSGATIFVSARQTGGAWSCPQIWRTHAQLGLAAAEDIDALAIDEPDQLLLFSTRSHVPDQLMILDYGVDVALPIPYLTPAGVPISDLMGIAEDDDIDAICAIDPSVRGGTGAVNGIAFFMGTPRPKSFAVLPPADLESSAFRLATPGPADSAYRAFVSGWPATGVGPGVASLFWSLADQPNTLVPFMVVARNALDPICGNPVAATIPVPDVPAMRGVQVDLRWFVADAALTSIHEAFPIQVRL